MIFSRKTMFVAGAVLLAACGDKVTVAGPSTPVTPVSVVNSVSVAPASATLSIGQSITMTAAVNADAGLATTVTWSASASNVTVSSAGVVTAVSATPGVAVCATSTVDTGKKGCATIVVTPAQQNIPATVSIQSITMGTLNTPVITNNVAGQINVTLNVNPGNQTITKVVLLVGGVRADSQTFTAAQAAALRFSSDEAIAAQTTFPQIVFSINTAAYNATTGIPRFLNGNQAISAQLYTTQGGTASAATASAQTTLTFNNIDGYAATVVTSGTTANALNSAGFRYDRGGLDVTVLPVIYTGRAIASATLNFGAAAATLCDASGTGTRTTALTAPAAGANAWTKTGWAQTTPSGGAQANYLTNYEFSAGNCGAAANATGETISVTAVDANGDAILAATAPFNITAANSLRLDNRAPAAGNPFFMANPNGRQNGWINGAVLLNGSSTTMSAVSNNWLFSGASVVFGAVTARDQGQGGYTRFVRIASATGGLVDDARAATASSAATLPAPSSANNTYCAIATAQDALGNETARPGAGTACGPVVVAANAAANTGLSSQMFGVDIAAPVITAGSSTDNAGYLDANERRGAAATMTNNFGVSVVDTGTVGNSGMLTNMAVMGTVILRNDANALLTAATKCVVGVIDSNDGVTCLAAPVNSNPSPGLPWVVVSPTAGNSAGAVVPGPTAVTATNAPGYYTYVAYARDAAGNQSGTITKAVAFDVNGNVPALTSAVYNTPLTGGSVTFNATASDNFDLWKAAYALTYGAVLPGPVIYPSTTINTFNGTQMFSNVAAGITIPNFVRQVETIATNNPVVIAGTSKPTALNGTVTDQSNQTSAVANTVIPGASVTNGVSYTAAPATQLVRSFAISNGATNVSDNAGPGAAVNATSVALVADVTGPTATFNPPFARVDFYAFVGGNMVQIGTTTAVVSTDDGSAFGRKHRYTFTWTPGTLYAPGATSLYAIGVNAAGDALVTPASAAITITNP